MNGKNSVLHSLEIIENHISEKLTIQNIASGVYLSQYHYQRLFREFVGDSVMEYVTRRKLTLAGRALLETDATILDIALDYGYDSRDGFSRSFKAYMGVTPTEYRKYGLSAISQKSAKERPIMSYSKTTDEIIRELNKFIVKAKYAAETARKCDVVEYTPFWNHIADKTDGAMGFVHKIEYAIERVAVIADHPDEITNRFNILKAIDDTAFTLHVMGLHASVRAARAKPEDYQVMRPICERYLELGTLLSDKVLKIMQFFNEMSVLIIDDMRKTFAEKMEEVVRRARVAADMISGYDYIKREVSYMAEELAAVPIGEVSERLLNDNLFKLPFLRFSIDADIIQSGGKDKDMFSGVALLEQSIEEALDFIRSLPQPKADEPLIVSVAKTLDDIGYHGNILLFFTRGEAEHLGELLDEEQKAIFDKICEKINHYIHFTQKSADQAAFKPIADRVYIIKEDMAVLADSLGEHGGAVKILSDTFKQLYDKVVECMETVDSASEDNFT